MVVHWNHCCLIGCCRIITLANHHQQRKSKDPVAIHTCSFPNLYKDRARLHQVKEVTILMTCLQMVYIKVSQNRLFPSASHLLQCHNLLIQQSFQIAGYKPKAHKRSKSREERSSGTEDSSNLAMWSPSFSFGQTGIRKLPTHHEEDHDALNR